MPILQENSLVDARGFVICKALIVLESVLAGH